MKLNVNELSRDELRNLMKSVSIEALRIPVKENVKLEKKYITGFRASSVTYIQLVPLYYQEIHNGNRDVERALVSSTNDYLKETKLLEQIRLLKDDQQWHNCVKIGIVLGSSMCEIDFSIITKIFAIEIPVEKIEAISLICEQLCEQKMNVSTIFENYENEKHSLETQIEKLLRDKLSLDEKKNAAIKQRENVERELRIVENELKRSQHDVEEKNTTISENEKKLKQQSEIISGQKESLSDYKLKLFDKDGYIKELNKQIQELEKVLAESNAEKLCEYNNTIQKLVVDTIEDLKENYMLDADQFEQIIGSIDGEHNIVSIWQKLSAINASIIEDIETAMRNNIVTTEIIDKCDDVENNILIKYIILKAIKSLYFEYLSMNEKKKTISEKIF